MTVALIVLTVVTGVPIGLISVVFIISILTGWLEKVSWLIAILPLPLSVFVGGLGAVILVRRVVRKLEARCAAIPPSKPGESASCHVCGAPLAAVGEQAVVRCQYCQSDNLVSAKVLDRARIARDVVMQDYAKAIRQQSLRVPTVSVLGSFGWAAAVLVTMVGSCGGAHLYDNYLETVTGPQGADKLLDEVHLSRFQLVGGDVVVCETRGGFSAVPKPGGKTRVLRRKNAEGNCSKAMATDGKHIYWARSGKLRRMAINGSGEEILAEVPEMNSGTNRLAVDETHVYGTFEHGILKAPKSAGERTVLVNGQHYMGEITTDATHLYWFDNGGVDQPKLLQRVAKTGGEVQTLDRRESLRTSARPVLDDSYIYVVADFGNAIDRIPKGGGKPFRLVRHEASDISELALDRTHLYFATRYDSLGCTGSVYGSVARVPKAGGTVEVLTEGLKTPNGLQVDSTHVYWYDVFRNTLMRVAKQP